MNKFYKVDYDQYCEAAGGDVGLDEYNDIQLPCRATALSIDADYSGAKNGGHIMAKLTNDGSKRLEIKRGEAFMQGIILPYFKTDDDEATAARTGGFGSTG